jgi:hypothetical protein
MSTHSASKYLVLEMSRLVKILFKPFTDTLIVQDRILVMCLDKVVTHEFFAREFMKGMINTVE